MDNYILYSILILISLIIVTNAYTIKYNIIEARKDIDEIKQMKKDIEKISRKIESSAQKTIQYPINRQAQPLASGEKQSESSWEKGKNAVTDGEDEGTI